MESDPIKFGYSLLSILLSVIGCIPTAICLWSNELHILTWIVIALCVIICLLQIFTKLIIPVFFILVAEAMMFITAIEISKYVKYPSSFTWYDEIGLILWLAYLVAIAINMLSILWSTRNEP